MSEIEDTADMEFDELHVNLGELNLELNVVESHTDGQDVLEDLLGIVSATMLSTLGMEDHGGGTAFGVESCQGSSPSLSHTRHLFATQCFLH